MTKSEWEALGEAFRGGSAESDVDGLLRALLASPEGTVMQTVGMLTGAGPAVSAPESARSRGERIEDVVRFPAPAPPPERAAAVDDREDGASGVSAGLQAIGMVTGVGPLVTGLLKLFGSGGEQRTESMFAPVPFSLPEQVSVEAGLLRDRRFVEVGYGLRGVREFETPRQDSSPAAQIQINVSAMDSRSFADHSDEIARAVREAMLRSHTLNDVIAEM